MSHFWEILKALGPWGVLIVSTVDSLGIPNPGGTDWLLVGMAIARPNDAALCAAMAVLGSLLGTAAFFDVMQRGWRKSAGARYTIVRARGKISDVVSKVRTGDGVRPGAGAVAVFTVQSLSRPARGRWESAGGDSWECWQSAGLCVTQGWRIWE